jgi:hypothetical protein
MRQHPLRSTSRESVRALVMGAIAAAGFPWSPGLAAPTGDACPETSIAPYLLEGDAAPGTGAAFQVFDRPNLSAAGRVFFAANTDGPTDADDVVYLDAALVAREGDAAPGVPGGVYDSFEFFETGHQVNALGSVAFVATLREVAPGTDRVVVHDGALVARSGDAARGGSGRVLTDFGFVGVTDGGAVGYLADLDGSSSDDSVIYLDGEPLYREGDPVPVLPVHDWDANFDELQWNGRGDLLFAGSTTLPSDRDLFVFRRLHDHDGHVMEEVVAREGQTVAAHTGTDELDLVLQTALGSDGRWALRGLLELALADANSVVMTEWGFLAQESDPIPELPGARLGNFAGVAVNGRGDVLYLADIEGPAPDGVHEGLFLNGCLLVTDGVPVPGLPDGAVLTDLGFEDLSINDDRVVVFAAGYGGAVSGDGLFTMQVGVPCPADLDGSGVVGIDDLWRVLHGWGPCVPPSGCVTDLDGDGFVGFGDVLVILVAWGPCA